MRDRRVPMCELTILDFFLELSVLHKLTKRNHNAFYQMFLRIYRAMNLKNQMILQVLVHKGHQKMIKLVNPMFYLELLPLGLLKLKKISF